jgi:DnaK suppressor protein
MSGLSDTQLKQLETTLGRMREDFTERLSNTVQQSRTDAAQLQQLAQAQRRRDEAQLKLVGSALARLRNGLYGECLRCEEPIGFERLESSPETPMCRACRQSIEQR